MRWWVATLLGACSFSGRTLTGDMPDAPSAGDADLVAVCTVAAPQPSVLAGASLGESGTSNGNLQNPLLCPAGQLPIGVGFDTTMLPRFEGGSPPQRVATAITVACGSIIQLSDGHYAVSQGATSPAYSAEVCTPTWGPFIQAPPVVCPDGDVVVGFKANEGNGSTFNTVALICAPLTPAGAVGTPTVTLPITDTDNHNNQPQTASCVQGEAVVGIALRGNCDIDKLTPMCAALACQ
jgi:hypothetical protein